MKATEMLKKQHREVATLFRKALNSDQPEEKAQLTEEIVEKLTLHASIEEEFLYPAFPKTTQTIDIEGFVDGGQIPPQFLERPYYVAPVGKAEKVYVLLREAMREEGVVGIARIVMRTKAHLAALIPTERALLLVTLRWASEIRPVDGIDLPAAGRSAAKLEPGELETAMQRVGHLTTDWKPERYADSFGAAIRALVVRKARAGKEEVVEPLETPPDEAALGAKVVDLTELLRKSLGKKTGAAGARLRTKRRSPPRSSTTRRKRA